MIARVLFLTVIGLGVLLALQAVIEVAFGTLGGGVRVPNAVADVLDGLRVLRLVIVDTIQGIARLIGHPGWR